MKINCIFEKHLYALVYPNDYDVVWTEEIREYFSDESDSIDEMHRLFELWTNPYYLIDFFKTNECYLENPYWSRKNFSIEELAKITREKAIQLEKCILDNADSLNYYFQPLNDFDSKIQSIGKSKLKNNWLRVYAIKIDENNYLISGGAVKLTKRMEDHPETRNELTKLQKAKIFLQDNGVIDSESYDDFLYELRI